MEFTKRGTPHFHFFCTHVIEWRWLATQWYHACGQIGIDHFRAGTRIERFTGGRNSTAKYARKYACKQEQKQLPALLESEGFGRWWGISGNRKVVAAATTLAERESESEPVRSARENLESTLNSAVFERRARRFDGQWATVWIVQDEATEEAVKEAWDRLIEAVKGNLCPLSVVGSRYGPSPGL